MKNGIINTMEDLGAGKLANGIETPIGTLYAVHDDNAEYPGIRICMQPKGENQITDFAVAEYCATDGCVKVRVYPNAKDFDADPEITPINFNDLPNK